MLDGTWLGVWISLFGVILGILQLPNLQRWLQRRRASKNSNGAAGKQNRPSRQSAGLQADGLGAEGRNPEEQETADALPDIKETLAMLPKVTFETATASELPWIAELESDYYGEHAVPLATIQLWFAANSKGFFIIRVAGDRVGHATLLPVHDDAIEALVEGKISEKDLRAGDLWSPAERERVRSVYIESIVADSKVLKCQLHQRLLVEFLKDLHRLISCVANPRKVDRLYAYPATPRGLGALEELGFDKFTRATPSNLPPIYAKSYRDLIRQLRNPKGFGV